MNVNICKRCVDVILASIALVMLAPLLTAIGLAIYLHDGLPVLFRHERVGLRGRRFRVVKFRTMRVRSNADSGSFDAGDTSRVTRVGRFLRKSKLDELPQLWNVLRGEMSMVGPRPEVQKWVDAYPERWALILEVRPGITDPASVVYRNEEDLLAASPTPEETYRNTVLPHKLSLYEQYVRTLSLGSDLRILLLTLVSLFSSRTEMRAS